MPCATLARHLSAAATVRPRLDSQEKFTRTGHRGTDKQTAAQLLRPIRAHHNNNSNSKFTRSQTKFTTTRHRIHGGKGLTGWGASKEDGRWLTDGRIIRENVEGCSQRWVKRKLAFRADLFAKLAACGRRWRLRQVRAPLQQPAVQPAEKAVERGRVERWRTHTLYVALFLCIRYTRCIYSSDETGPLIPWRPIGATVNGFALT